MSKPSTDQIIEFFNQIKKGQIISSDVQGLIERGTRGLKNLFKESIALACKWIPEVVSHSPDPDDKKNYIGDIQDKVVCIAVEALTIAGEWARAKNLVSNYPSPKAKARALVASTRDEAQSLLGDIAGIENPYCRDDAMATIITLLPKEEARKKIDEMTSGFYKVRALTFLGGEDDLAAARLEAANIKEQADHTYLRAEAWMMIARVSGNSADRKEAFRVASEEWDKPLRIEYLAMAHCLSRPGISLARPMVFQLSDPFARACLYAAIGEASRRSEDFQLALREIGKIKNGSSWKAEAAARIALSLANVL